MYSLRGGGGGTLGEFGRGCSGIYILVVLVTSKGGGGGLGAVPPFHPLGSNISLKTLQKEHYTVP